MKLITFIICSLFVFNSMLANAELKGGYLISKEEAALPDMHALDKQVNRGHSIQADRKEASGPIILIEKPKEDKFYSDLIDILVKFEKNPMGVAVNMESVRVIYLKAFGIDITDRLQSYIKGNQIDAHGVKFPEGDHKFEIRVKDQDQVESSKIISIHVAS